MSGEDTGGLVIAAVGLALFAALVLLAATHLLDDVVRWVL